MEILLYGDPHGDFRPLIDAVEQHAPKAVILLGDLQPARPLDIELETILADTGVWFIHGNHDTDSEQDYDNVFESGLRDRNLDGRVVEIAGHRVAGLGGVFRGKVWLPPAEPVHHSANDYVAHMGKGNRWRGGLPLKQRSTIFPATYEALKHQKADLLVTHEAPGCHAFGFAPLDVLARTMGVKRLFHGHQHETRDYQSHRDVLGFSAFGVGQRGLRDQDGAVIRLGDGERGNNSG